MTLGEKQERFAEMLPSLLIMAKTLGYKVRLGEVYRTPEQAALNATSGKGISNSLHTKRLAIDLNLFKDGIYLTKSEDYTPLGTYWESIGGSWGGRFSKPDGNHFSLEHEGVK